MEGTVHLRFDDTIILGGRKIGPMDTMYTLEPSDFYGNPPIKIEYERYKAQKVDIEFTYCFY
jgi:hypothetical protein